jgi:hypothetical protein
MSRDRKSRSGSARLASVRGMPLVDVANARLVPFTGSDGWLVRVPHAVAFVSGTAEAEVRTLLGACEGASSSAEVLGRVVGRLSGGSAQDLPPFGLVTSADDGLAVLVHGRAAVEVTDKDGAPVRLSPEVDGQWLTRTIPGATRVTFGGVPPGATSEGLTDLRGGVLPVRGALLIGIGPAADEGRPAAEPAAAGVPSAAAPPGVAAGGSGGTVPGEPSEALLSQMPDASPAAEEAAAVAAQRDPAPAGRQPDAGNAVGTAGAAAPADEEGAFGGAAQAAPAGEDLPTGQGPLTEAAQAGPSGEYVRVTGRYCGRGHFNAPRDHWCRICGLALSTDPADEVEGDRPPLAQLIWDNGEGDLITTDTVVGRDPASDQAVKAGHAVGLSPSGQSEGMSRIHAELRLVGWEVLLADRGSTNGTFVWDEGQQAWQRLEVGERQPLNIGSIVAFGERTATLESPLPAET